MRVARRAGPGAAESRCASTPSCTRFGRWRRRPRKMVRIDDCASTARRIVSHRPSGCCRRSSAPAGWSHPARRWDQRRSGRRDRSARAAPPRFAGTRQHVGQQLIAVPAYGGDLLQKTGGVGAERGGDPCAGRRRSPPPKSAAADSSRGIGVPLGYPPGHPGGGGRQLLVTAIGYKGAFQAAVEEQILGCHSLSIPQNGRGGSQSEASKPRPRSLSDTKRPRPITR